MSEYSGKSGRELEALRAAKAAEWQKIMDDNSVERDGKRVANLSTDQLNDLKTRHAELEAIGAARDEQLNLERMNASVKSIQDDAKQIVGRPQFGGTNGSISSQTSVKSDDRSYAQQFVESKQYQDWLRHHPQESQEFETNMSLKVLTTGTSWAPQAVRAPLVVPYATRPIQVTDLIPTISTNQNAYVYMEETTFTNAAVEIAEGAAKPEANLVLTQRTSPVRKIAVYIAVTDEQLEDVPGMQQYIEQRLGFMVRQRLDSQILVGSGVAPNLLGILNVVGIQTQAKAADPTPDAIHKAMTKVEVVGQAIPSAVVLHPNDWQEIRLLRTTDGIYIWGNPSEAGPMRIWGLPVVSAQGITEGTGLVGDFENFSLLVERKGLTLKIGYNADDWVKNQRTIIAEMRVAFVVTRPAAFCSVTGI